MNGVWPTACFSPVCPSRSGHRKKSVGRERQKRDDGARVVGFLRPERSSHDSDTGFRRCGSVYRRFPVGGVGARVVQPARLDEFDAPASSPSTQSHFDSRYARQATRETNARIATEAMMKGFDARSSIAPKADGLTDGKNPAGGVAPLPAAPPCRRLPERPARCATMNRHGHPAHSDAVSLCSHPHSGITPAAPNRRSRHDAAPFVVHG